jgi:microsomal prostaglandin-E synthase 1
MQTMTSNPTFTAYSITTLALCLNLLALWGYSGATRATSKIVINEEDARTVARGADYAEHNPPAVARVLRAHANAMAMIVPFLMLGWLFVALGGSALQARIMFGVFVVARYVHSIVYIRGLQPARTIVFVISGAATAILFASDVWLLLK